MTCQDVSAVPELRFPGFEREWEARRLGECLTIGSGKDYKHLDDGDIPVYGTGGLMTHVNEFLYDGKSIGIGRKGTINKPIWLSGKFWTVDTLFYTHSFKGILPKFVYGIFQRINWLKYNEASGVPSLSKSTLETISLSIPTLPEQKKIAVFLSAVDEKLAAIEAQLAGWRDFKRGMMQALFTQTLRFKADDGSAFPDWVMVPLKKLAKRSAEKNSEFLIKRVLSNSAIDGVVDQSSYFDRDITTASNLDGYYIVRHGDFVYNPRVSKFAPVGPISRNNIADGVMSPLYTVFTPEADAANYLEAYFKSNVWNEYVYRVSNVGARHDRMNILNSEFMDMPINLPSISEQQKIVDYLSALDTKIDVLTERLEATREFKRGLLQKMFV